MSIKKPIFFLTGIIWPISLYLISTPGEFIKYILPASLLIFSFWLYKKEYSFFLYPLLLTPFIDEKLALFPIFFIILISLLKIKISGKNKILFLIMAILIVVISGKGFKQNSIFKDDYEERQKIIQNIHLYPDTLTARIYQNKLRIYINKFSENFFGLIDPGNYFFSFHPRGDILINKNLVKFPFITIIPILIGFLEFKKIKNYKFIIVLLSAGILSLSFIEIFDRTDFILWPVLMIILVHGIESIKSSKNKTLSNLFFTFFIAIYLIEFIRLFYIY